MCPAWLSVALFPKLDYFYINQTFDMREQTIALLKPGEREEASISKTSVDETLASRQNITSPDKIKLAVGLLVWQLLGMIYLLLTQLHEITLPLIMHISIFIAGTILYGWFLLFIGAMGSAP